MVPGLFVPLPKAYVFAGDIAGAMDIIVNKEVYKYYI